MVDDEELDELPDMVGGAVAEEVVGELAELVVDLVMSGVVIGMVMLLPDAVAPDLTSFPGPISTSPLVEPLGLGPVDEEDDEDEPPALGLLDGVGGMLMLPDGLSGIITLPGPMVATLVPELVDVVEEPPPDDGELFGVCWSTGLGVMWVS